MENVYRPPEVDEPVLRDERCDIPEDKSMAVLAHLSTFGSFIVPFGNIIGPLIFYLIHKDKCPYTRAHAASALNFQMSITLWVFIGVIGSIALMFVSPLLIILGLLLVGLLVLVDLVCTVIAAVQSGSGKHFNYPLTFRLIT